MRLGVNSYAIAPEDFPDGIGATSIRLWIPGSTSDADLLAMVDRFAARPAVKVLPCITHDLPDGMWWSAHALRVWNVFKMLGDQVEGIELSNENNLKVMGPFAMTPIAYGQTMVECYRTLRQAGCTLPLYAGSISSLSYSLFYARLITEAGANTDEVLSGLLIPDQIAALVWLDAAMQHSEWPDDLGVTIHRYNTGGHPPEYPTPGNRDRDQELERLFEIIGPRAWCVTEMGQSDGPEAGNWLSWELDFWQAHGASAVYVYCYRHGPEPEVESYGLVECQNGPDGQPIATNKAVAMADWAAAHM